MLWSRPSRGPRGCCHDAARRLTSNAQRPGTTLIRQLDLDAQRRCADLNLIARPQRHPDGIMRLDLEEGAVAHDPRPVVTAIVKHAILAARSVVSDRGVGTTDGAGVIVAVFKEHHMVRAEPAEAVNRLRAAPDADVRFGE